MALGVEVAGLVAAVGDRVEGITVGDRVTGHSAPLREQGTWAEQHIAAAAQVAVLPAGVPFAAAAALPVPALTADQVIDDAMQVRGGETVLVHGAGGVDGAANAARGGSIDAVRAVRDGGRLATITADLPHGERGVTIQAVQVMPDGARLADLAQLLAQGALTVAVADSLPLERAAEGLAQAKHGAHGSAVVLRTGPATELQTGRAY
jgi:NADPH:quinone reductase-like Zn-dependent oxidoreductase